MTKQHQVHTKNLHRRGPEWRRTQEGHRCGYPDCDQVVAGRLWGCKAHWFLVSVELRDDWMTVGAMPKSVSQENTKNTLHQLILNELRHAS